VVRENYDKEVSLSGNCIYLKVDRHLLSQTGISRDIITKKGVANNLMGLPI
jgi:hypothetical protein